MVNTPKVNVDIDVENPSLLFTQISHHIPLFLPPKVPGENRHRAPEQTWEPPEKQHHSWTGELNVVPLVGPPR